MISKVRGVKSSDVKETYSQATEKARLSTCSYSIMLFILSGTSLVASSASSVSKFTSYHIVIRLMDNLTRSCHAGSHIGRILTFESSVTDPEFGSTLLSSQVMELKLG